MGFLSNLTRGAWTTINPDAGVAPADESVVRERLRAISGEHIATGERDGRVVISWSANVASEERYRAIEVQLDASRHVAHAVCVTQTDDSRPSGMVGWTRTWGRGTQVGVERDIVLPWFGRGRSEAYRFDWQDLRRPVIDAVTGAGWTYKPRRM
jgi:hypothetical protein